MALEVRLAPVSPEEHAAFFALFEAYYLELEAYDPSAEGDPHARFVQYRDAVLNDLDDLDDLDALEGDQPRARELLWIDSRISSAGDVERWSHAGLAMVRTQPDWPEETRMVAEVAEFYVRPEARGAGIGKRAVELLLEEHRRRGTHLVEAAVLRGNERARAFWERLGFLVRSEVRQRAP